MTYNSDQNDTFQISLRKIVDNTASITGGGGGSGVNSVNGRNGNVVLSSSDVGLGNANNTSDAAKPVSTAQQAALDLKLNLTNWSTLTGTTPALTFSATPQARTLTLSGDTTFSSSGYGQSFAYDLYLTGSGSSQALTFPGWTWVGGAPSTLAAGKHMAISLICTGSTAASVFAVYAVET